MLWLLARKNNKRWTQVYLWFWSSVFWRVAGTGVFLEHSPCSHQMGQYKWQTDMWSQTCDSDTGTVAEIRITVSRYSNLVTLGLCVCFQECCCELLWSGYTVLVWLRSGTLFFGLIRNNNTSLRWFDEAFVGVAHIGNIIAGIDWSSDFWYCGDNYQHRCCWLKLVSAVSDADLRMIKEHYCWPILVWWTWHWCNYVHEHSCWRHRSDGRVLVWQR